MNIRIKHKNQNELFNKMKLLELQYHNLEKEIIGENRSELTAKQELELIQVITKNQDLVGKENILEDVYSFHELDKSASWNNIYNTFNKLQQINQGGGVKQLGQMGKGIEIDLRSQQLFIIDRLQKKTSN